MSKKEKDVKSPVIKLVPGANVKFRANSARGQWYDFLVGQVGKTEAEFIANAEANPPSTPKKGKLAGQTEPPKGWLSFFLRNGYAEFK